MCWLCDNPERTVQDYEREMAGLMRQHGWAIQYVQASNKRSPWAYTIGLTEAGLPELVVTALPPDRIGPLLNGLGRHLLHEEPPLPGDRFALTGTPMLEVVTVAEPDVHLPLAVSLLGPGIKAIQLVWSDDRGHWPWDRGFRSNRWPQPVLGPRAPHAPHAPG